jgi:hypothetical protein
MSYRSNGRADTRFSFRVGLHRQESDRISQVGKREDSEAIPLGATNEQYCGCLWLLFSTHLLCRYAHRPGRLLHLPLCRQLELQWSA